MLDESSIKIATKLDWGTTDGKTTTGRIRQKTMSAIRADLSPIKAPREIGVNPDVRREYRKYSSNATAPATGSRSRAEGRALKVSLPSENIAPLYLNRKLTICSKVNSRQLVRAGPSSKGP